MAAAADSLDMVAEPLAAAATAAADVSADDSWKGNWLSDKRLPALVNCAGEWEKDAWGVADGRGGSPNGGGGGPYSVDSGGDIKGDGNGWAGDAGGSCCCAGDGKRPAAAAAAAAVADM